jgi:hypothetical protein
VRDRTVGVWGDEARCENLLLLLIENHVLGDAAAFFVRIQRRVQTALLTGPHVASAATRRRALRSPLIAAAIAFGPALHNLSLQVLGV